MLTIVLQYLIDSDDKTNKDIPFDSLLRLWMGFMMVSVRSLLTLSTKLPIHSDVELPYPFRCLYYNLFKLFVYILRIHCTIDIWSQTGVVEY